jgi:hypothetical protein
MSFPQSSCDRRRSPLPALPEAILLVLAPFAPLFSHRVWRHAQVLLLGAMLAPGARAVTAALRVMGLATARHVTHDHRVLNRATGSARHGRRRLLGVLLTLLVPPSATLVLGADDPVDRRAGRKITAQGCAREAVRSSKQDVIRCCGLKWVSMVLLVPVPWSRRVWAVPFLTSLCWPAEPAIRHRPKTRVDWVRQLMPHARRWLPGRRVVLVVDGGFAAVSLALACVKHNVVMGSRLRWDAARDHPPGPQPPGTRAPNPRKGQRQRSLQGWAERAATPGETVQVECSRGQLKTLWVCSRPALWYTPRLPPVAIRVVIVCAPDGKLRLEAFFGTDRQATPVQIWPWVVLRWSVEVPFEDARAHLGFETQRQWSDKARAHTTPVRLELFSLVTLLALPLSQRDPMPVSATAWYRKGAPTFTDGLALVRQHRWRAR